MEGPSLTDLYAQHVSSAGSAATATAEDTAAGSAETAAGAAAGEGEAAVQANVEMSTPPTVYQCAITTTTDRGISGGGGGRTILAGERFVVSAAALSSTGEIMLRVGDEWVPEITEAGDPVMVAVEGDQPQAAAAAAANETSPIAAAAELEDSAAAWLSATDQLRPEPPQPRAWPAAPESAASSVTHTATPEKTEPAGRPPTERTPVDFRRGWFDTSDPSTAEAEAAVATTLIEFYRDHEPQFATAEKAARIIKSYKKKAAKRNDGTDWRDLLWGAYNDVGEGAAKDPRLYCVHRQAAATIQLRMRLRRRARATAAQKEGQAATQIQAKYRANTSRMAYFARLDAQNRAGANTRVPRVACTQKMWNQLHVEARKAAAVLGWNEVAWDEGVCPSKHWLDLLPEERVAAVFLGFEQRSWDLLGFEDAAIGALSGTSWTPAPPVSCLLTGVPVWRPGERRRGQPAGGAGRVEAGCRRVHRGNPRSGEGGQRPEPVRTDTGAAQAHGDRWALLSRDCRAPPPAAHDQKRPGGSTGQCLLEAARDPDQTEEDAGAAQDAPEPVQIVRCEADTAGGCGSEQYFRGNGQGGGH
eukprot:SAG22_NODE_226_length_14668_cov_29.647495_4_plen_586_part_00